MSNGGLVLATLGCLGLLVMQIVGIATPHWYDISVGVSGIFEVSTYGGLFQVCTDTLNLGCVNYFSYGGANFISIHYIAFGALLGIGTLLLAGVVIAGLAGCSREYSRPTVQNMAGIGFAAGGCICAGVTWFGVTWYNDTSTLGILTSSTLFEIVLGYSFYLCAASGGVCLIFSITACVIAGNMERPIVAPQAQQQPTSVFVVGSTTVPAQTQPMYGQPQPMYGQAQPMFGQPQQGIPMTQFQQPQSSANDPSASEIPQKT